MRKRKRLRIIAVSVFTISFIGLIIFGLYNYRNDKVIESEDVVIDDLKEDVITEPESESTDEEYVAPMNRRVDFNELKSINEDVVAWLYVPGTHIDEPVMQEPAVNEYMYLNRNIYGEWNSSGSIFIPKTPGDTEDAHILMYGHNMSNGKSGFSELSDYKSESYRNDYPYVYVYYPDRVEQWSVYAAVDTKETDPVYTIPYTLGSASYQELLDHFQNDAIYTSGLAPTVNDKTLVLSTCDGRSSGSDERFYIVCTLSATKYY